MQPEDKTVLRDGECPWCHQNSLPPGILWMASSPTMFESASVFCGHCPDGKLRKKEEALRDLLRSKR